MEVLGNHLDMAAFNSRHNSTAASARMRAISLGDDQDSASLNGAKLDLPQDLATGGDNNTSSLKTYMTNIVANQPEKNKHELNRTDMYEAGNRSLSWKERMNDYSFMKR